MRLDFLKKAKKSQIMAFTVAICCIILVGYYFLFLSPVISRSLSVFREVAKVQSRLDQAELSINRMPTIKEGMEELRSKASFYSNKLPKEEEFPAVLENLSNMAKNAGVKIIKILPVRESLTVSEESTHPDIYRQKEINVNAQCGYHQLGTFVSELENAERFMEVSDIRIEARRISPKRHNVQLIVKTFILLEGEQE